MCGLEEVELGDNSFGLLSRQPSLVVDRVAFGLEFGSELVLSGETVTGGLFLRSGVSAVLGYLYRISASESFAVFSGADLKEGKRIMTSSGFSIVIGGMCMRISTSVQTGALSG